MEKWKCRTPALALVCALAPARPDKRQQKRSYKKISAGDGRNSQGEEENERQQSGGRIEAQGSHRNLRFSEIFRKQHKLSTKNQKR